MIIYLVLGFLLVFGLWFLLRPDDVSKLVSNPHAVVDYAAALAQIDAVHKDEHGQAVRDICRSNLLTHGFQTEHVLVLMHGYTNCPEQFREIGMRFYDLGYNVYIPRMPYHGKEDRLTREFSQMTGEALVVYGDQAADVAHGLGRHVTVFGISAGGTVTAWLAQNRSDVDFAVPLSAFLRVSFIPRFLVLPFINLIRALPEIFVWWDPRTKDKNPYSPDFAYPQYSLGNLAQIMRLGRSVEKQAVNNPPLAGQILMVINDFDPGVSNPEIRYLLKQWMKTRKDGVYEYHFEREMKMLHDIITPGTPGVPSEVVFQRLIGQVQSLHRNKFKPIQ